MKDIIVTCVLLVIDGVIYTKDSVEEIVKNFDGNDVICYCGEEICGNITNLFIENDKLYADIKLINNIYP